MMNAQTRLLVLTSLFTALTVIGAQMRVPLPLVPISLQDFFVVLSGLVLGARHGALSQLLYLALGLAGLPIFTKGGGPAYVLQPTFGYLLGFPIASFVAGRVLHGGNQPKYFLPPVHWSRLVFACVCAIVALFALGVGYLWVNLNWVAGREMTFAYAVYSGAIVFLPAQALKIFLASVLYRALQRQLAARMPQTLAPAPRLPKPEPVGRTHNFINEQS